MPTTKPLFKGTFNYHGEIHIRYTHAATELGAFCNIIRGLATDLDTSQARLAGYFSGTDHYKIEQVRKEDY